MSLREKLHGYGNYENDHPKRNSFDFFIKFSQLNENVSEKD